MQQLETVKDLFATIRQGPIQAYADFGQMDLANWNRHKRWRNRISRRDNELAYAACLWIMVLECCA